MGLRGLRTLADIILHLLMLLGILALWNNEAPQFIYVAF
jgi:hypothetical protein